MGNCCGKADSPNFQGEGRTLGATPASVPAGSTAPTNARIPAQVSAPQGGRTLGKNGQDSANSAAPSAVAARAAEERQKAAQGKGKLGRQLDAQKAQTQTALLTQNARDNVEARDADAATQARNWN